LSGEEKTEKTELPVKVFQDLEKRDEDQILAEMRGEILEDLVYDITIQSRRVTNLSYAGIKEAIRRRGHVEILEYRTEETDKEVRAILRVRDLDNRIDVLGASSAAKDKPFGYTLAVNKAERNAFAKLIPARWLAVLIDEYLIRRREEEAGPEPSQAGPSTPRKERPKEAESTQRLAYLRNVLRRAMKEDVIYKPVDIVDMIRVEAPDASDDDVGTIMLQLLKIREVEQVYDGEELRGWRKVKGRAEPSQAPSRPADQLPSSWTLRTVQDLFPRDQEEILEFEEASEWITVKPTRYLGSDIFARIAQIVRDNGGEYVSLGKDSHFRFRR